jgi:hypothetical protein
VRDLGELSRSFFFYQSEERRKASLELRKPWQTRWRDWSVIGGSLKPPVEVLLEAGHVHIKAKDFSCEGMLDGELLRPPNTLLPDSFGHRAIMGPAVAAWQIS